MHGILQNPTLVATWTVGEERRRASPGRAVLAPVVLDWAALTVGALAFIGASAIVWLG